MIYKVWCIKVTVWETFGQFSDPFCSKRPLLINQIYPFINRWIKIAMYNKIIFFFLSRDYSYKSTTRLTSNNIIATSAKSGVIKKRTNLFQEVHILNLLQVKCQSIFSSLFEPNYIQNMVHFQFIDQLVHPQGRKNLNLHYRQLAMEYSHWKFIIMKDKSKTKSHLKVS